MEWCAFFRLLHKLVQLLVFTPCNCVKMPPKAKGKKAVARKMPPPMPLGEIVVDVVNRQEWVLGRSIGKGGFGEIYLASRSPKGGGVKDRDYVIKIEPFENGPLFSELSYYRRAAKEDSIAAWLKKEKLTYVGIPPYIASGRHTLNGKEYRFLVMQRFGDDIEKYFRAIGMFCEDTVCYLALRLLEALQYLHEVEYVHADLKGSNILTGHEQNPDRVYLVDYGLAYRFNPDGRHCEYKKDPRRAHDGTVEFTSIDAHDGVNPSRRGDLEILGYCLLQWNCGRLPWEDNLVDKNYVARRKREYKADVPKLLRDCFSSSSPPQFLAAYMTEVFKLDYTQKPNYSKLKGYFTKQLKGRDPKRTLEWSPKGRKRPSSEKLPQAKKEPRLETDGPGEGGIPLLRTQPKAVPVPSKVAKAHRQKKPEKPVIYPGLASIPDSEGQPSVPPPIASPSVRRSSRRKEKVDYKGMDASFEKASTSGRRKRKS